MNKIISALERALEEAEGMDLHWRAWPLNPEWMTALAVVKMGRDHITETLAIFRHARKLKNELDADRKPPGREQVYPNACKWPHECGYPKAPRKEKDAPD